MDHVFSGPSCGLILKDRLLWSFMEAEPKETCGPKSLPQGHQLAKKKKKKTLNSLRTVLPPSLPPTSLLPW